MKSRTHTPIYSMSSHQWRLTVGGGGQACPGEDLREFTAYKKLSIGLFPDP